MPFEPAYVTCMSAILSNGNPGPIPVPHEFEIKNHSQLAFRAIRFKVERLAHAANSIQDESKGSQYEKGLEVLIITDLVFGIKLDFQVVLESSEKLRCGSIH